MAIRSDILSKIGDVVLSQPMALCTAPDAVTYSTLWHDAMRVATYLDNTNSQRLVGICINKSYKFLPLILGVWMSGRAYVPFDVRWPRERYMQVCRLADIDKPIDDALAQEILSTPLTEDYAIKPIHKDQWAYVIFTSGTTGVPKGVIVAHNGLMHLATAQGRAFGVDSGSRYLWFLSPSFDASVSDILVTLTSGATLVIEPSDVLTTASKLMSIVKDREITHIDIPPALLKIINPDTAPECLKTIVIGGEAANIDTVRQWAERVNLVDVYGPTEATVCTSLCKCASDWSRPLIGKVIDGVNYRVVDCVGVDSDEGELWISGDCLALGYLNQPELTAMKFPVIDGTRYYRTSDKVRRLPDGEYEFLGRVDRQFKFNGQLIEPEDIERNLMRIPSVRRSAVVLDTTASGQRLLTAYVECDDADFNPTDIKNRLADLLPKWMIPGTIIRQDKLPETTSGKIDYSALKPIGSDDKSATVYIDDWTARVAEAFGNALELKSVAPHSHLCELGATSLQTLVLITELEKIGIYLTTDDLRLASSPIEIAQLKPENSAMAKPIDQLACHWAHTPNYRETAVLPQTCAHILITGATGFLGSHVCHSMLAKGSHVYCLVRCKSASEGMARIINTLDKHRLSLTDEQLQRLHIVQGDITKPRLGIDDDTYHDLVNTVDAVYHGAATVNMLAGFDALYDCNVQGVMHVLDFCCTGRHKTMHYASTLSVKVATDRNRGRVYESDTLIDLNTVYGGYAQTKVVADMIMQRIKLGQCRVKIYRYGLLCGSTHTGQSSQRDFLSMFFRGARRCRSLPIDPSHRLAVDVTPIDFATDITTRLICKPSDYHIFNIAGQKPLPYSDLSLQMLRAGIISDLVPYEDWVGEASNCIDPDVRACIMALCRLDPDLFARYRYMDLMQSTDMSFDMARVVEVLGQVTYPTIDSALLNKYFDYALS